MQARAGGGAQAKMAAARLQPDSDVSAGPARTLVDAAALRRYPVGIVASTYDLDRIRAKLAGRKPRLLEDPGLAVADAVSISGGLNAVVQAGLSSPHRKAAVAAILRPSATSQEQEAEVLLIRRAERAGDPWSGHMAFPGGHQDPGDPDSYATALRETQEEIGLDLRQHEYLGQLDELPATIRAVRVGISIAPHVFALRTEASFRPNYEVAEIVWGGLGPMARGEIDAVKEFKYEGRVQQAPGFRVGDHVVWGLTHRMLMSLFDLLA
jgi:8-oxo-dGTP pyrophosphatase MutT (NUDIX family)